MAGELIYAFRVMRLPLLDAGGEPIGQIADLVAVPGPASDRPPRVIGFVASAQGRKIFVNSARISDLDSNGVRLKSWDVDLNPFRARRGETLVDAEIIDRTIETGERISDLGLRESGDGRSRYWEIEKVRLAQRSTLRRRSSYRLVDWDEIPQLIEAPSAIEAEAARLRDMHPTDVARIVRTMPLSQRRQLAESMDDERLADVLEELPEAEQLRLIADLDLDRLVDVFNEMEFDDLADLLGEMPQAQRASILDAMDDEDAETVERLLSYEAATAGGLMTPEIVILSGSATVAEALAHVRDPELVPSLASMVFITQAPFKPPTGRYLGVVFIQRLLREPPSMELRHLIADDTPTLPPDTPEQAVFEEFASYDMLAIAVVDDSGYLLGAVSVDDVVDRMLGTGWRLRHRRQDQSDLATPSASEHLPTEPTEPTEPNEDAAKVGT